jgi:HEAT repeat protein
MAGSISEITEREDTYRLLQALNEGNYLEQIEAANALRKLRDEKAILPLIRALNGTYHVQKAATGILITMGDMVIEPIMQNFVEKPKEIQEILVYILQKIGSDKAVNALVLIVNDKENNARTDAIYALGDIGGKRPVESLLKLLKDDSFAINIAAYRALRRIDAGDIDMRLIACEVESQCIKLENEALNAMRRSHEVRSRDPLVLAIDGSVTSTHRSAYNEAMNRTDIDESYMLDLLYDFCIYVWHMMEIAKNDKNTVNQASLEYCRI